MNSVSWCCWLMSTKMISIKKTPMIWHFVETVPCLRHSTALRATWCIIVIVYDHYERLSCFQWPSFSALIGQAKCNLLRSTAFSCLETVKKRFKIMIEENNEIDDISNWLPIKILTLIISFLSKYWFINDHKIESNNYKNVCFWGIEHHERVMLLQ